MYGAGSGAPSGQKFGSTMFGQTLLKSIAQKENTGGAPGIGSSQMFQPGSFAKYIASGESASNHSGAEAPFGAKEQNLAVGAAGGFTSHQKTGSTSGGSLKSLSNAGKEGDETGSNC